MSTPPSNSSPFTRQVALGLGGNVGETAEKFRVAVETISRSPGTRLTGISSLYDTTPIGVSDGRFLNAVATFETTRSLVELLRHGQQCETDAGRTRGQRWDARPLDVDVLLTEGEVTNTPTLTVPHPLLHVRRFVLDPLAEIWPDAIHPIFQRPISELQHHWVTRPLRVSLRDSLAPPPESNPQVCWTDTDPDLTLCMSDVDAAAWPPKIDLRSWPLAAPAAITAALAGVLDEPRIVGTF